MTVAELILEGIKLMLLGMGSVFTFLIILVFSLVVMTRIARFIEHEEDNRNAIPADPRSTTEYTDPALPAVIGAAVSMYRRSLD